MDLFMLSSALLSNPVLHPKRQIPKEANFPEKNGIRPMGTFDLNRPHLHTTPALKLQNFHLKGSFLSPYSKLSFYYQSLYHNFCANQ